MHAVHLASCRGIAGEAFCEAIEDARRAAEAEFGIVLRWCFDIPGEAGHRRGRRDRSDRDRGLAPEGLVSFGLGGPEIGVPRPQFKPHFDRGHAPPGCTRVPHAGETTGPETIWDALTTCGAERIGHGTSSVAGPGAARPPRRARHPARGLPDLERRHPRGRVARRAPDHGDGRGRRARSPINSDDPPMFATTLNQEYAVAAQLLDLDREGARGPGADGGAR